LLHPASRPATTITGIMTLPSFLSLVCTRMSP
jgi:hypothetical protein